MLASASMLRRILLMGSLLALIAALLAMWAFRYERLPEAHVWRLADLRAGMPSVPGVEWSGTPEQPRLRLRVDAVNPRVAVRIAIPGVSMVEGLHLRFQMHARELVPGSEKWQDGRFMVEWHYPEGGGAPENDPVASVYGHDRLDVEEIVVHPKNSQAVPALRLEHLGRTGEFELPDLEITAVKERAIWKTGRWFLAIAWLVWITAFVSTWPGICRRRALCASFIWVVMAGLFVVPGPWKIQRALVYAFQLGDPADEVAAKPGGHSVERTASETVQVTSGAIEALGKVPTQGGIALRVKHAISSARPLLHVLLLFGPTFVFVWLLGSRPAVVLSAMLALSIELAQLAFGYGFDLVDVGDLATDAAGIALGLWGYRGISKRSESRKSKVRL